jgi:hypothetical protein
LLGIAEVVRRDQPHLLAKHAAGGVEVGHGQPRAALKLLADPAVLARARDRASQSDQDFRLRGPAVPGGQHNDR